MMPNAPGAIALRSQSRCRKDWRPQPNDSEAGLEAFFHRLKSPWPGFGRIWPGHRGSEIRGTLRRSLRACGLRCGKAAHDQAIDARRKSGGIVGHLPIEDFGLLEQQCGKI